MRWPLEDEIRWIEWRLAELAHGEWRVPVTPLDCRIWLVHRRDGKSYADIARAEYPRHWKKDEGKRGNQKVISLVRRSVDRVEHYFNDPARHWTRAEKEELARIVNAGSLGLTPIFFEANPALSRKKRTRPKWTKGN